MACAVPAGEKEDVVVDRCPFFDIGLFFQISRFSCTDVFSKRDRDDFAMRIDFVGNEEVIFIKGIDILQHHRSFRVDRIGFIASFIIGIEEIL